MNHTSQGALYILPEPGLAQADWLHQLLKEDAAKGPVEAALPQDEAEALADISGLALTPFNHGNLTPARHDMANWKTLISAHDTGPLYLVRNTEAAWGYETYYTFLRLAGRTSFTEISQRGPVSIDLPPLPLPSEISSILITICGGIGNVIQATPVLTACVENGMATYFAPASDSDGSSLAALFEDAMLPGLIVVDPADAHEVVADLVLNLENRNLLSPSDAFFSPYRVGVDLSESGLYGAFLRNVTGMASDPAATFVGGHSVEVDDSLLGRVVVCPGSKPGWEPKRWPHMNELLTRLDNPLVLCLDQDLAIYAETQGLTPITASNAQFATDLELGQAAQVLRAAKAVLANDCGLAHMAAAVGAPTLILFGPSSERRNQPRRDNVRALSLDMECRPCQGRQTGLGKLGPYSSSCMNDFACLKGLTVDHVFSELQTLFKEKG
ncbi:MAG: hypothetical protein D6E12_03915 [Desulfovibrio sp.]|nr:MAG: hypothetical protein D6E12_03915 [Desulfovibrio sp.]